MTEPIVALDVETTHEALTLVRHLDTSADFYKVGLELFSAAGPHAVEALREVGKRVFLDLKFHDIPTTVAGAARSAARIGATLVTAHASGGATMIRAAVEGAREGSEECLVLAVTVLTSLDAAALGAAWGRAGDMKVVSEVLRLAETAVEGGAAGIVCSGGELGAVRERFGERLACLVPGIRFAGGASHDQARVVTPEAAAAAGARYVVLGRAVTAAAEPREAMARANRALGLHRPTG